MELLVVCNWLVINSIQWCGYTYATAQLVTDSNKVDTLIAVFPLEWPHNVMEMVATAHDTTYTSFCNISHYTTDGQSLLIDPRRSVGLRRIDFDYTGAIVRKFQYGSGSVIIAVGY